mmetsp:Transcript_8260/g.14399  ORF Transcript_8260/g.14399 Transcript_8260/m.14399 type:complete len:429 (-) Transcript_8260:1405-2691(-)
MKSVLERGGGAFRVDALSGWDLHDAGPAKDSKVLLAARDEFHQLASARRRGNVHATMAQCAATSSGPPRTVSVRSSLSNSSNSDPLPSQVASEDAEMRTATQLSSSESQQQRNRQHGMNNEYERAVLESQLDYAAPGKNEAETEEEVNMALERSVIDDEQHRQQLTEQQYEDALMLAMEQSTQEANKTRTSEDDSIPLAEDQYEEELRIALENSTQETHNTNASEDDLMQQALDESMALAEAEVTNTFEDDFLEKALAESLLEEDRRKASEHNLLQEAQSKSSEEEEMLMEAMRLSLKEEEEEATTEEEAMKKVIEMSKHAGRGELIHSLKLDPTVEDGGDGDDGGGGMDKKEKWMEWMKKRAELSAGHIMSSLAVVRENHTEGGDDGIINNDNEAGDAIVYSHPQEKHDQEEEAGDTIVWEGSSSQK